MNATTHNFTPGALINSPLRAQAPLTIDALKAYVPSAFAKQAHESRSERYTYIPTSEVIAGLMREGFQPYKAVQSRSRIAGKTEFTKHLLRFRHPDAMIEKVGDAVPEVILINSHDGTSAYKLSAGLYRLVCSNGLMVSDSTVEMLTVMHKGNIVDQVIEGSFQIVQQSGKTLEKAEEFRRLQLTAGEQGAFADAARELRFGDAEGTIKTPITAAQLLRPRRDEDANGPVGWRGSRTEVGPKPDLWHTFNVVQENVIKGGLHGVQKENGKQRRITTREVKAIDQDVKLNRALWLLTERMAELKKAA